MVERASVVGNKSMGMGGKEVREHEGIEQSAKMKGGEGV